ncbi:hypothetical protein [Rhizobium sp. BK176]|uniref:hypothetical protein n=1 Tax=Rhizobium sp. BK176 TaxID=2587071 RepID=UPI0021683A64|nr:hypothetical protein [Rhizobium sp. BK176]MCS4089183.1 hypothetical protein [Rhizobium sp. BK176]
MKDERRAEMHRAWNKACFPAVPTGEIDSHKIFMLEEEGPRYVNSLASFSLNRIGHWLKRADDVQWEGDDRFSTSWSDDAKKGKKTCILSDSALEKSWSVSWFREREEDMIEIAEIALDGTLEVLASGEIDDGLRVERLKKHNFYTTPSGPGAVMGRFHNEAYVPLFILTTALSTSMPDDFRKHTHDTVTGEVVWFLEQQDKLLAYDGGLPGALSASYVQAVLDDVTAPVANWVGDTAAEFAQAMTEAGAVWGSAAMVYHDGDITSCVIPTPDGSPAFYHGNRAKWTGEVGLVAWFENYGKKNAKLCVEMLMDDKNPEDVVNAMLSGTGSPSLVFDFKNQRTVSGQSSATTKEFFFFDFACDVESAIEYGKLREDCRLWPTATSRSAPKVGPGV